MAKQNKFGTFGGVFTPSILTILGVIMYMRLPMIVGQAGLLSTIGIIIVAHIISSTTGLSVSSIATDKKVQAGGTYYMISRSLGLPIGGTLGLALFVGLSFSVSLYLIGFAESFLSYWGFEITKQNIQLCGSLILLTVTIITFISTKLAIKTQYVIMTAIALSLISVLLGHDIEVPVTTDVAKATKEIPLMVLFGIFFPAVTGFEAGVSMSGDLKDPKKSIPLGAIMAISVGLVVYILLSVFLSKTVNHDVLAYDPEVLLKISLVPELVVAGIWGATLSSALGSILGAPRILQATAVDKITPRFFAKGTGDSNEPRNALLMTFLIAEAGILIGELDVIARIVSIFFITTYGFLNMSCAFETMTSADFRPSFKTPSWISIIGSLACIIVMIQLDFMAMVVAIIVLGLVFYYIRRRELALQSGDAWASFWASVIKAGLKRVKEPNLETRNWRPNVIMFSGDKDARPELIEFGKSIVGKLGILSAFDLIETKEELLIRQDTFTKPDQDGFSVQKHKCRSIYEGMDEIVRAYGFQSIQPNTIFMGLSNKEQSREPFLNFVRRLDKNNFNSVFMSYSAEKGFGNHDSIDVYWNGEGHTITLAINLLRHLTASNEWEDANIRLMLIANDSSHSESMYKGAESILDKYRTYMQIVIINNSIEKLDRNEIILRESANTSLTVINFADQVFENFNEIFDRVEVLRKQMGSMIFLNASRTFEYHNILPKTTINLDAINKTEGKTLPDLQLSIYPNLNKIINELDNASSQHFDNFFKQTKICHVERLNLLVDDFEKLADFCSKSREKLEAEPSTPRRKKAIDKLRGEFIFKVKKNIEQFIASYIEKDKDLLDSSVKELLSQLTLMVNKVENSENIQMEKDIFLASPTDKSRIKAYKWRKRVLGTIAGQNVTVNVPTRKMAQYFVLDKRLSTIQQQLNNWQEEYLSTLNAIKQLGEQIMDDIILPPEISTQERKAFVTESENQIAALRQKILKNEKTFESSLQIDNRQEINLMVAEMTKFAPRTTLKLKRRPTSYYRAQRNNLEEFSGEMYEAIQLYLNKNSAEVWINDLQYRINVAAEDHHLDIFGIVNSQLIQPLKKAIQVVDFEDSPKENLVKKINELPEFQFPNSFENSFEEMANEVLKFTQQLPDNLSIAELMVTQSGQPSFGETIKLPLRRMSQYYIESGFTEQMKKLDSKEGSYFKEKAIACNETISRLTFEVDNLLIKDKEGLLSDAPIIQETHRQLTQILEEIQQEMDAFMEKISTSIAKAFEPLSPYRIAGSAKEMSHFIREYQGRQTLSKVGSRKDKIARFFYNQWVSLIYKQSKGVLLAKQLSGDNPQVSPQEYVLQHISQVMPKPHILKKVPVYYQNLFSGSSSIVDDFWIERTTEQNRFETLVQKYKAGYQGAILILGNKNSGKTAFSRFMAQQHFKGQNTHFILPPLHGSRNVEVLQSVVNKVVAEGDPDLNLSKLKKGSVIIFNDLELWWENNSDGDKAVRQILHWINIYSHKYLFIINTSRYSYKAIHKHVELDPYILGTVECLPFGAEEIRNLIMSRHRSSGMIFSIGKYRRGITTDIRLAALFNKFFIHSNGNPGLSLYSWLASIEKITGNHLVIHPPKPLSSSVFEKLTPDWNVVLSQIFLHKRMDVFKLKRVLHMDESEIEEIIRSLLLAGLINERNTGLYTINPAITHWLANYLKNKNSI